MFYRYHFLKLRENGVCYQRLSENNDCEGDFAPGQVVIDSIYCTEKMASQNGRKKQTIF